MEADGANSTVNAAVVSGALDAPGDPDYESCGIGFAMQTTDATVNATTGLITNASEVEYDLTGATGFSFYHKGESVNFSVITTLTKQDAGHDFSYVVPAHTTWTKVTVDFADLAQESWVTPAATWDPSTIVKLQWQVKGGLARSYTFGIDEVSVEGKTLTLPSTDPVNVSELTTLITQANAIESVSVMGSLPGQYALADIQTFTTAIAAAQAVADAAATQLEVDNAIATLEQAITDFQASVIQPTIDVSELTTAITAANTTVGSAVSGSAPGNYPASAISAYNSAIATANAIKTNPASQAEVDQAIIDLSAATTTFEATVIPPVGIDLTDLNTAISNAQDAYDVAVVGAGDGQYPASAKTNLSTAIDAATTTRSNAATQAAIDQAEADLIAALSVFNNSVIGVSTALLEAKIATAQSTVTAAVEGTSQGQYPYNSKTTLSNAISAAQAVVNSSTATQAQIDQAVIDLQDAIDTFESLVNPAQVDKSELETLHSVADELYNNSQMGENPGQYPISAFIVFYSAIQDAREIIMDDQALQADVIYGVQDLQDAIDRFNSQKVPGDVPDAIGDVEFTSSVYPNPCSSSVNISSTKEIKSIQLVSITGSVKVSQDVNATATIVNVSGLANGVYFVEISYLDNSIETIKVTKK